MKRHTRSVIYLIVALTIIATFGTACTTTKAPTATPHVTPIAIQQSNPPAIASLGSQPVAPAGFAAPGPGPNLLAKDWPSRLGISVSELKQATGKAVLNPKDGDLYFFSNSSTTWGATNTKNNVWVIDAKTKKTIGNFAPPNAEGYSSHGLAVSGDGKYIYLPMLGTGGGKSNHTVVMDGRTMEVVQTITTLGRAHHWKLWHDPLSNKDLILGEDFNWSMAGSGIYAFDPSQQNAVIGGMTLGDFAGNPYVTTPAPDGSFIVVTVPAPTSAMRDKMDGYLAKVDPKTWKVVGMTPMIDPLWAEVSLDGKYAYVTSGAEAKLYKVNLGTMALEGEVQTGPGPWGARISYDQTRLYTADKGEGPGYNQQGRTTTIIDLTTSGVIGVEMIGLTTDHAILSPDGKEVWFTSNADHNIYILDTATNKVTTVLQDPADGDIHGGVFVQYKNDGKGNIVGEVVADYSGLHGTALAAERSYVAQPTLNIALDRNGFLQKTLTLTAKPGETVRVVAKNSGGTSGGKIAFESKDLGIAKVMLDPGDAKEFTWKVPDQPGTVTATTDDSRTNKSIEITVKAPAASAAPTTSASRTVKFTSHAMKFDLADVDVKPGETITITIVNGDDEKHNLVGVTEGMALVTPDAPGGKTISYTWTAPAKAGDYKAICAYHPEMIVMFHVK